MPSPTPISALRFVRACSRLERMAPKFPVRWLPSRQIWEVDARPYGRIYGVQISGRKQIKFRSRDLADDVAEAIADDIERGVPANIAVAPYLPNESLLETWVEKWIASLKRRSLAGDLSSEYVRKPREYAKPDGHFSPLYGRSIHSLTFLDLEDFSVERLEVVGQTTVAHIVSSLRTCLRWTAKRSGGTFACPEFPVVRRGEFEPQMLEPAEQDEVLAEIDLEQRGAYLAMADLMIRPNEARACNVENYDFGTRELKVEHAMKGPRKDARRGPTKGRDRRLLVVGDRVAEWLESHVPLKARINPTRPLFEYAGDRWADSTLRHGWDDAVARSDAPRAAMYCGTKHSTATWLRKQGLSLDELRLALGHSDGQRERVTERYARPPRIANAHIIRLLNARQGE